MNIHSKLEYQPETHGVSTISSTLREKLCYQSDILNIHKLIFCAKSKQDVWQLFLDYHLPVNLTICSIGYGGFSALTHTHTHSSPLPFLASLRA